MKNKKLFWKILLCLGLIPFLIVLLYSLYSSIFGFSLLCFSNCTKEYGIIAFFNSLITLSYVIWPFYFIGLFLIILSVYF